MKKGRRVRLCAGSMMAVVLLAACGAGETPALELPATPVITVRDSWAVVRGAYVRILSEPAVNAAIEGHVRRGVILALEDRTPYVDTVDGQRGHWMAVAGEEVSGWIFGAYVDLYPTRQQAETAALTLRGD